VRLVPVVGLTSRPVQPVVLSVPISRSGAAIHDPPMQPRLAAVHGAPSPPQLCSSVLEVDAIGADGVGKRPPHPHTPPTQAALTPGTRGCRSRPQCAGSRSSARQPSPGHSVTPVAHVQAPSTHSDAGHEPMDSSSCGTNLRVDLVVEQPEAARGIDGERAHVAEVGELRDTSRAPSFKPTRTIWALSATYTTWSWPPNVSSTPHIAQLSQRTAPNRFAVCGAIVTCPWRCR